MLLIFTAAVNAEYSNYSSQLIEIKKKIEAFLYHNSICFLFVKYFTFYISHVKRFKGL